jgi:hypothetical protein
MKRKKRTSRERSRRPARAETDSSAAAEQERPKTPFTDVPLKKPDAAAGSSWRREDIYGDDGR